MEDECSSGKDVEIGDRTGGGMRRMMRQRKPLEVPVCLGGPESG